MLAESWTTGVNDEIRKDAINELERLVGCRSPELGLENVREDAGGRLLALLRSEVLCADPLELNGHELTHVVLVVAGEASGSCEIASVRVNIPLWYPGAVVNLRSNDVC